MSELLPINLNDWTMATWYQHIDARDEEQFWQKMSFKYSSEMIELMQNYGIVLSNSHTTGLYVHNSNMDEFLTILKLAE